MNSPTEPILVIETIPITVELGNIIKAIGKQKLWKQIFAEHCARLGLPTIPASEIERKRSKNGYIVMTTTWQGRNYKGCAWESEGDAQQDLFLKIMQGIIEEDFTKTC